MTRSQIPYTIIYENYIPKWFGLFYVKKIDIKYVYYDSFDDAKIKFNESAYKYLESMVWPGHLPLNEAELIFYKTPFSLFALSDHSIKKMWKQYH